MQALSNQPLAVSVYLFPYIYDLSVAAENSVVLALCESVISLGGYVCEVLKIGSGHKEDDFNYSQVTFPETRSNFSENSETHDEVVEILLKEEKQLDVKKAKGKTYNN